MPFSERKFAPEEVPSAKVEQPPSPDFLRMNSTELAGYKAWKENVPMEIRSLVEGHILGKNVRIDKDGFPSVVEFYRAMRDALSSPQVNSDEFSASEIVKKQITALQNIKVGDATVNIFSALADVNLGFQVKENYVQTKLLPRLDFLRMHDERESMRITSSEQEVEVFGEEEEDEYSPHRTPEQESEGLPSEAIATLNPFFGGYVMDAVFDQYDSSTLTWKTSGRSFSELPNQKLDQERARLYRSRVKGGYGAVKLPRGWGSDRVSVKWEGQEPTQWNLEVNANGVVRVRTQEDTTTGFSINIAPSKEAISLAPPTGEILEIFDRFPAELLGKADEVMKSTVSDSAKARRIASIIHKHLEYDTDVKWEVIYKADQEQYFEKIWEHKKAKCDEANTLLTRLLTKLGLHARFMGGHSVRQKSPTGEAMLLESNRHAWASAWDDEVKEWIRLDATPAGDPNVDQEEQQDELGEGDYGEQEAELMNDEELEKRLLEVLKEEEEERERKESEDPILTYAKEAECSLEEAREVLDKIENLRKKYARVLKDADKQWKTLVRKNIRERTVDRGPFPMSQMDEIDPDELVSGYIEMLAGERDPLIGQREASEQIQEKWFGGYEVYLMADLSGSMSESVNGTQKSHMQRDMIFLITDSCMNAAATAKQADRRLKAPMPVKVSLVVFGVNTEIVLPLTERWTPKEQIQLYRALDKSGGGATPDDEALQLIESEIAVAKTYEKTAQTAKPAMKKHGWEMRRFVIAVADGGSDRPSSSKKVNERLKDAGVPVDLLLIAPKEDKNMVAAAQEVYQSVIPVPDVVDLAEKGLTRLTQRVREAYVPHPKS